MKKPTSHQLDQLAKRYILDAIDSTSYQEEPLTTTEEKIQFLKDTFTKEMAWSIERYGTMRAMIDWLQGLPSSISIVFYNSDILDLAVKWGALPEVHTDQQANKILENYWNFMANKGLQLTNGYHVPLVTIEEYAKEVLDWTYFQEWFALEPVTQKNAVESIIDDFPLPKGLTKKKVAQWVAEEVVRFNKLNEPENHLPSE